MLNSKTLIGDRLVILPSLLRPLFLFSRPPASLRPRASRDNIRKDIIIRSMDLLLPFFNHYPYFLHLFLPFQGWPFKEKV